METLARAITEYFDYEYVDVESYPEKHRRALYTQTFIGWRQFFQGKISVEWLILQGPHKLSNGNVLEAHIWGANIVELTLRSVSELWKERNEEVHGKTDDERSKSRRTQLGHRVRNLHRYRNQCRPSDEHLFKEDHEKFIREAPISQLATYVATKKKAIMNSVKQAAKGAVTGTTGIMQYFPPVREGGQQRIMQRLREKFRYEAYAKKKRRKDNSDLLQLTQESIVGYISLTRLNVPTRY